MIAGVSGRAGDEPVATSEEDQLARVEFFSDAVFAIAITLLVLDISVPNRLPARAIPTELEHLIPQVAAYVLSFAVVGIFWLSHHRMFHYLRRQDTTLLLLNLLFLLLIALLPFPTKLLADYGTATVVAVLYPAMLSLTALALYAIWRYATVQRRLVDPDLDDRTVTIVTIRSLGFAGIFVLSMLVALVSVRLAEIFWLLAALAAGGLQLYPFSTAEGNA
jgi:uncharacterized membrane protein